jgi:hypothetical protein
MKNKKLLLQRIVTLSSVLAVAALLLTACGGAFSFQGSANPNAQGGVDITAGSQPGATAQPSGMNQTTLILIVVGVAIVILVLILLAARGKSKNEPPS